MHASRWEVPAPPAMELYFCSENDRYLARVRTVHPEDIPEHDTFANCCAVQKSEPAWSRALGESEEHRFWHGELFMATFYGVRAAGAVVVHAFRQTADLALFMETRRGLFVTRVTDPLRLALWSIAGTHDPP